MAVGLSRMKTMMNWVYSWGFRNVLHIENAQFKKAKYILVSINAEDIERGNIS